MIHCGSQQLHDAFSTSLDAVRWTNYMQRRTWKAMLSAYVLLGSEVLFWKVVQID